MSDHIGLDIRVPISGLFGVLGLLLSGYGLAKGADGRWINVNLWWGLVMLVFSAVLYAAARHRRA